MQNLDQVCDHLRFLGYEVVRDGEIVRARHPVKFNISMKPFGGGVLLAAVFGCSDNARRNRGGYLELINALNRESAIARFYADKESDFWIEAWHPAHYDRLEFGSFLEIWDRDCALLGKHEAGAYLK